MRSVSSWILRDWKDGTDLSAELAKRIAAHQAARSSQQSTRGACQLSICATWRKDETGRAMRTRRASKGAGTLWRKSMRVGDPASASTMAGLSGFSCSQVADADAWGCGAGPCCILGCVQLCRSVSEDNVDSSAAFLSRTSQDVLFVMLGHHTTGHVRLLDALTVLSRVLTAVLLYLSSHYLTLFDASPRTLLAPSASPAFASALLRWDVIHFAGIAKDGYSCDYRWAFFPGVPLLLRVADRLPTFFSDNATSPFAWLALLHVSLAIPTTRAIYHLTSIHFRSPSFALLTAFLSLLPGSPVTLYFAPYAEPIFTFLSYQGACTCLSTHCHVVHREFCVPRNARLCAQALPLRLADLRSRSSLSL